MCNADLRNETVRAPMTTSDSKERGKRGVREGLREGERGELT